MSEWMEGWVHICPADPVRCCGEGKRREAELQGLTHPVEAALTL